MSFISRSGGNDVLIFTRNKFNPYSTDTRLMFYLHFNAFWLAVVDYLFDCLSYLFDSFDYLFDGFDYLFDGLSYLFDSFRYLFDGYDVTPTDINIYQIRKVDDNSCYPPQMTSSSEDNSIILRKWRHPRRITVLSSANDILRWLVLSVWHPNTKYIV